MAEFAEFTDSGQRHDPLPVTISPLALADVATCAQLAATREGEPIGRWVDTFTKAIDDPGQLVLVAHHGALIAGYGKATWMKLPEEGNAPSGWYLTGVVVDPSIRRRGVGEQLTAARLAALQQRGVCQAWFFANARNQVAMSTSFGPGLSVWLGPGWVREANPE